MDPWPLLNTWFDVTTLIKFSKLTRNNLASKEFEDSATITKVIFNSTAFYCQAVSSTSRTIRQLKALVRI